MRLIGIHLLWADRDPHGRCVAAGNGMGQVHEIGLELGACDIGLVGLAVMGEDCQPDASGK